MALRRRARRCRRPCRRRGSGLWCSRRGTGSAGEPTPSAQEAGPPIDSSRVAALRGPQSAGAAVRRERPEATDRIAIASGIPSGRRPALSGAGPGRVPPRLRPTRQANGAGGQGRPGPVASELLVPGGPWNPLLDAVSGYYNGCDQWNSVLDYDAYVDTGTNCASPGGWRVRRWRPRRRDQARLRGQPTDHGGPRLRPGQPARAISTAAVIVTVPTPILASGRLRVPANAAGQGRSSRRAAARARQQGVHRLGSARRASDQCHCSAIHTVPGTTAATTCDRSAGR